MKSHLTSRRNHFLQLFYLEKSWTRILGLKGGGGVNFHDCRARKLKENWCYNTSCSASWKLYNKRHKNKKKNINGKIKSREKTFQSKYPLDINKRNIQYSKCHVWRYFPIKILKRFSMAKPHVITNWAQMNFLSLLTNRYIEFSCFLHKGT